MTHGAHGGFPWIVPAPIWYGKREEESSRPEQGYDLATMRVVNCILTKLSGLHTGSTEPSGLYVGSGVLLVTPVPLHMIISLIQEHPDLYKQCLCELYGMCGGVSGSGEGSGEADS